MGSHEAITLAILVPTRYNCTKTVRSKYNTRIQAFTNKFSQKKGEKATTVGRLLRTAITTKEQVRPEITRKIKLIPALHGRESGRYRFRKSTNARVGRKYVPKMHTLQRGGGVRSHPAHSAGEGKPR